MACNPTVCASWSAFLEQPQLRLALTVAPLERGLLLTDPPLAVILEAQLYGERVRQSRQRVRSRLDPETILRDLTDLSPGAPVVHEDTVSAAMPGWSVWKWRRDRWRVRGS